MDSVNSTAVVGSAIGEVAEAAEGDGKAWAAVDGVVAATQGQMRNAWNHECILLGYSQ